MLYYGIKVVNTNIIYLDYLKNPIIFKLDLKERKLYLFGESYLIDLKIFKKVLKKRPGYLGLLFYLYLFFCYNYSLELL